MNKIHLNKWKEWLIQIVHLSLSTDSLYNIIEDLWMQWSNATDTGCSHDNDNMTNMLYTIILF